MLTVTTIGRLTADIEVKTSQQGNQYAYFKLAVNKGFGDKQKTVFLQCLLHGEPQVQRMVKAKVKKGSLISLTGDFDLEAYEKKDKTKGMSAKITVYDWNYVPSSGKPTSENAHASNASSTQPPADNSDGYNEYDCGDDDDLPL